MGFRPNLLEHMAFKTLQPDAVTRFSLEDVFVGGDGRTGKLAWVSGWRKLPHLTRDVEKLFDYPQQFAEDIFNRIEQALRRRVADDETQVEGAHRAPVPRSRRCSTGRFAGVAHSGSSGPVYPIVGHADRGCAQGRVVCTSRICLSDRREGKFVLSYETPGGWVAITKSHPH